MAEGAPDFENPKRPPRAEERVGSWMRGKWFELTGKEEPPKKEITPARDTLLSEEEARQQYEGPQLTEDQKNRQKLLVEGAQYAVQKANFTERNTEFAKTVAHTAALSFKSLHQGDPRVPSVEKLEKFYYKAALKAGEKFRNAFDQETGEYLGVKSFISDAAGNATEVNREMMSDIPALLKTSLKNPDDAWQVARRAGFRDAAAVFSNATGMGIPKAALTESDEEIRKAIKRKTKPNDMWGIEMVDTMPMQANFEGTLSGEVTDELLMYDMVESLANATFLVGQVHRAYAGETNRIDPNEKLNFNPRDVMLREKYWEALEVNPGGENGRDALYRVMFEQRKDMHEILADKKEGVRGEVGLAREVEKYVYDFVPFIVTADALKKEGRDALEKQVLDKVLASRDKLQQRFSTQVFELEKRIRAKDSVRENYDQTLIERNALSSEIQTLEKEGVSETLDKKREKLSKAIERLLQLETEKKKVGTSFESRREQTSIENAQMVLANEKMFIELVTPIIHNAVSYHIDRLKEKEKSSV